MDVLIDTSVLIAWEREGRPAALPTDVVVAVSAITASELLHGVHRANTAQRRHRRQLWVESVISSLAVLPFDLNVARVHARIWADLMASGSVVGAHDIMIGATAIAHGMTVATRNQEEFQRLDGLSVTRW